MIAITARAQGLQAPVESRFGRCSHFILYNPQTKEHKTVANPSRGQPGGAGVAAAQFLTEQNAEVLLTGNIGPKALQALKAANMQVYTVTEGTVEQAVADYDQGKLKQANTATVHSHHGLDRMG